MAKDAIQFVGAIIIVSKQAEALAAFYRDVLELPLEQEQHDDTLPHWGCTLGSQHFAIHPPEDFPDDRCGVGAVKLAFNTFDIHGLASRLRETGVELIYEPYDNGFMWTTAIHDPDGNFIELTQLSDAWYEEMARSRPPRDQPWYHVLVHDASHTTYVAERNLAPDESREPVRHPQLALYFTEFSGGRYTRAESGH